MNGSIANLANIVSQLTGLIVLSACVVLWMHKRSPFVLVALIGEAISVLCHLALTLTPTAFTDFPVIRLIWPAGAAIFAIGLLGYALGEIGVRAATGSTDQGT